MKVLLLCAGNTCRSPMAEGILKKMIRQRGLSGVSVYSCGVSAIDGEPANTKAIKIAAENGIDLSGFVASRLTDDLLCWADAVVCMTPALCGYLKTRKAADFSLLYGIPPIIDPYGGTDEDYREAFFSLKYACGLLLEDIVNGTLITKINNSPYEGDSEVDI